MKVTSWRDAWHEGPGPKTRSEFIILYMKGFLMGIADLIPGVSGGTIAFITGIYSLFLDSIASINKEFFTHLLKLDFKSALSVIHLRFIIPVLFGILSAMLTLARLMHYLMNEHPIPTWATFFGLICASIFIIWKQLDKAFSPKMMFAIIVGTVFAYIMVSLIPVETPENFWFIYLCGIIGITAMILPGLSGSFLLLILGKYEYITGMLKNPFADGALAVILVFSMGTVTGLLGFSKILNFFMREYRQVTMAFLTGVLIGSMKKVWPWKEVLESVEIRGKVKVLREINIVPASMDMENVIAFTLLVIGFLVVIGLEKKANKVIE
ncbi:DUF368 domain-containing protein [Bacteriovorax sp. Seq25_V]|uniref:DUF368 domain-containing protein n=1 Tax=Bacteriovorax sp. Seq25_V TaxID=1201288 RepID=UPI00038A0C8A|nr:DUF368 domain-containing protein [Bacteriovorax sp. Seq25_V]EQC46613.1 PF04018 domain protein [Bacteriovorax sp. Seq25_V]